jgi:cell division protein FtsL
VVGWTLLVSAALLIVTWRQTRGLEMERELADTLALHALVETRRVELSRRSEELRSRARVIRVAGERFGMHLPVGEEIVFLPVRGVPPGVETDP